MHTGPGGRTSMFSLGSSFVELGIVIFPYLRGLGSFFSGSVVGSLDVPFDTS